MMDMSSWSNARRYGQHAVTYTTPHSTPTPTTPQHTHVHGQADAGVERCGLGHHFAKKALDFHFNFVVVFGVRAVVHVALCGFALLDPGTGALSSGVGAVSVPVVAIVVAITVVGFTARLRSIAVVGVTSFGASAAATFTRASGGVDVRVTRRQQRRVRVQFVQGVRGRR